jgi:hypothetical protein
MIHGLADRIRELWHWLTANKYVVALEAEVERLRAENRALMNSILGIAGIPPVITPSTNVSVAGAAPSQPSTSSPAKGAEGTPAATPLRRRSWQQINRTLEIEAARKKDPAAGTPK